MPTAKIRRRGRPSEGQDHMLAPASGPKSRPQPLLPVRSQTSLELRRLKAARNRRNN